MGNLSHVSGSAHTIIWREKLPKHGQRKRGALFTSADAAVMFERQDGRRQFVLIEWKYTEAYSRTCIRYSKSGTDRSEIYRHVYDDPACPLDKSRLPSYFDLFYNPFDQLMRQQFLAFKMEQAHEAGADIVSVLHIAPNHNVNFRQVTSANLKPLGESAVAVWQALTPPDRFASVSTEKLFGGWLRSSLPGMHEWQSYITARYPWVLTD